MNEDLIQLPELKDIKEMLAATRQDISVEVEEDPELLPVSKLLTQVIDIIEEKIAKHKDLTNLDNKTKIDIAAYLNFLQGLQEDFFFYDELDFEEEGEGEEEESEEK